jgi:hypothetical protein
MACTHANPGTQAPVLSLYFSANLQMIPSQPPIPSWLIPAASLLANPKPNYTIK